MVDGKKISKLLKEKNIISKELSSMLDNLGIKIGEESVRKYRTRSVKIPSSTVTAIAEILNVTEQELYNNFEEQKDK